MLFWGAAWIFLLFNVFSSCNSERLHSMCDECFESYYSVSSTVDINGRIYCGDCLSYDLYRCLECGGYDSIGSGYNTDLGFCDDCDPTPYSPCYKCDSFLPLYKLALYNDRYCCYPCIEKTISDIAQPSIEQFASDEIAAQLRYNEWVISLYESYVAFANNDPSLDNALIYHTVNCPYLRRWDSTAAPLEQFEEFGFTPCNKCYS